VKARETVAVERPSCSANSLMVIRAISREFLAPLLPAGKRLHTVDLPENIGWLPVISHYIGLFAFCQEGFRNPCHFFAKLCKRLHTPGRYSRQDCRPRRAN
jgi:hypothetical protein